MVYQETATGEGVLRDGVFIPEDLSNRDWRAYVKWRAAGNTPETAPVLGLADERAAATSRVESEAAALIAAEFPLAADLYVWPLEHAEAAAAIADANPLTEAAYPLLAALVGPFGQDLDEVAAAVQARADAIAARIAAVHTVRSQVLDQLATAFTVSAVRAVVESIDWPTDATPQSV